jgi:hypothetical protein
MYHVLSILYFRVLFNSDSLNRDYFFKRDLKSDSFILDVVVVIHVCRDPSQGFKPRLSDTVKGESNLAL